MATEIAPRIVVDPLVKAGRPVIKGTRVPVDLVVAKIGGGMTREEVMDQYGLGAEDVLAAPNYTARVVSLENVRTAD